MEAVAPAALAALAVTAVAELELNEPTDFDFLRNGLKSGGCEMAKKAENRSNSSELFHRNKRSACAFSISTPLAPIKSARAAAVAAAASSNAC